LTEFPRDPDGLLAFLARTWSEERKVRIVRSNEFGAIKSPQPRILLPSYFAPLLPQLKGFQRWREYRFSAWHEAMHIKFSPPKSKFVTEIAEELEPEYRHTPLIRYVMSLLEDVRIETLGLEIYKPYRAEQEWSLKMHANALRKSGRYDFEAALMGTVLLGLQPPESLAPEVRRKLVKLREIALSLRTLEDLKKGTIEGVKLLWDLKDWLDLREEPNPLLEFNSHFEPDPDLDMEEEGGFLPVLVEEYRSLEQSIKETVARLKYEKDLGAKIASCDPSILGQRGDWDYLYSQISAKVNELISLLRKWKVGWDETLDYTGDEVEPELLLISRFSRERQKSFINEEKAGTKTSLCILADFSASIGAQVSNYRKALAIITEALDYIGVKFSLYAFHGQLLEIIKPMRYEWDLISKERVAGIVADGNTPIAKHLTNFTLRAPEAERAERFVLITDGMPDEPAEAVEAARRMLRSGTRLGVLLLSRNTAMLKLPFFSELSEIPNTVTYCRDTSELPSKFFTLLNYLT